MLSISFLLAQSGGPITGYGVIGLLVALVIAAAGISESKRPPKVEGERTTVLRKEKKDAGMVVGLIGLAIAIAGFSIGASPIGGLGLLLFFGGAIASEAKSKG